MTVVSSEFWKLALAESQARGVRELPLVKVPHPVGTISLQALRTVAKSAVDAIVDKLLRNNNSDSLADAQSSQDDHGNCASLSVPSDSAEMFSFMFERGWTDG